MDQIEARVVESEPSFNDLTDKEKSVLIAMLTSKTDKEAIKKSPVRKTQFYKYKKKLQPLEQSLKNNLLEKALEILEGNTIKAAEALSELLDSHNQHVKHRAAVEVLDRTMGQPKKHVERKNITVIGIQGVTKEELMSLATPIPT